MNIQLRTKSDAAHYYTLKLPNRTVYEWEKTKKIKNKNFDKKKKSVHKYQLRLKQQTPI